GFNPLGFVPRQCSFEPGLPCNSYKLEVNQTTGTTRVIVQLSNELGYDIALPDGAMLIQVENIGKPGKQTYLGNCSPKLPYVIKKGASFTCIIEIPDREVIPSTGKTVKLDASLNYKNCLTDPNYFSTGNCTAASNYTSTGTAVTLVESYSPTLYCGDGICSASVGENPSTCPSDCPPPASLILTANPTLVAPDGVSYSTITATVRDRYNQPIRNIEVFFISTPIGELNKVSALTNTQGQAVVQLRSRVPGLATITAVATIANSTQVRFSSVPSRLKLTASDYYPPVCGFDSIITAEVTDQGGNPVPDLEVYFYHTSSNPGSKLEPSTEWTNSFGKATTRFYNDSTLETFQIKANVTIPESGQVLSDTITLSTSSCNCTPPPSGTWVINRRIICSNQTIILGGNLTIEAGGELIFLGNVTLDMNRNDIYVKCGGILRILDADRNPATPDGSIILGSLNQGQSFIVESCGQLELVNSNVTGIYDHLYTNYSYVGGCSPTNYGLLVMGNATIINSTILDSYEGITFMNSANSIVAGNLITNTGFAGVNLINTTDTIIYNNTFPDTGIAVCLSNSHRNRIDKNMIRLSDMNYRYGGGSSGGGGVSIRDGSTYNNITNNIITEAWHSCVFTFEIKNSHYNRIENNALGYCSLNYFGGGIRMSYSNYNVINNNSFRNIGYKGSLGIYSDSGSYNIISNNLINTTYFYGIGIKNGSSNRIENNIVGAVDYRAAIHVESAPSTFIYKNTVFGSIGGIKLVSSPESVIDSNNASGNVYYGPEAYTNRGSGITVQYSNNVSIINNYLENNGGSISGVGVIGSGIEAVSSNNLIIINNTAIKNAANGIYLQSSKNSILEKNNASYNGRSTFFCTLDYCYAAGIRFSLSDASNTARNNTLINNVNGYGFSCINNSVPTLIDNYAVNNSRGNWDGCPSPGGDPIIACGTITTNSILISDLRSSGTCITFGADNIILNCQGHTITGLRTANSSGVYAYGRKNIVLKNCIISNYSTGVVFNRTSQANIYNNTVFNNLKEGIYLYNMSNDTEINNNVVYGNEKGINIYLSNTNQVYNNTVFNNTQDGIMFYYVNQSQVFDNVVYNNGASYSGIVLNRNYYGAVFNNTIFSNNMGIRLEGLSNYNKVYNNYVRGNSFGIITTLSDANNIYENTVVNNNIGIYFSSSASNASLNNVSYNPSFGFQCSGSPKPVLSANMLAGNGNDLDACPQQISNPILFCGSVATNATLANDLRNSDTCINITADNIVLDCNGHSITGPGTASLGKYGIYAEDRKNITVKNCVIEWYDRGIQLNKTNSSFIYGNTVRYNTEGVSLYRGSSRNKVYGNIGYENLVAFYAFMNSNDNDIYNNTAYLNDWGVTISDNSFYNRVYNNTAYDNTDGVYIAGTSYTNVSTNTLTSNIYGIFVIDSDSTINIKSNNLLSSSEYGVLCSNSEPTISSNNYLVNKKDCSDTVGNYCAVHCYDT
ncbi:MAG: right-handed parallel beta-helix repeat-containing protein, partial [Candidatus Micrarchaeia archaeon]